MFSLIFYRSVVTCGMNSQNRFLDIRIIRFKLFTSMRYLQRVDLYRHQSESITLDGEKSWDKKSLISLKLMAYFSIRHFLYRQWDITSRCLNWAALLIQWFGISWASPQPTCRWVMNLNFNKTFLIYFSSTDGQGWRWTSNWISGNNNDDYIKLF